MHTMNWKLVTDKSLSHNRNAEAIGKTYTQTCELHVCAGGASIICQRWPYQYDDDDDSFLSHVPGYSGILCFLVQSTLSRTKAPTKLQEVLFK